MNKEAEQTLHTFILKTNENHELFFFGLLPNLLTTLSWCVVVIR